MLFYTLSRLKTIDERFKTNYLEVDIVKYSRQTMLSSIKVWKFWWMLMPTSINYLHNLWLVQVGLRLNHVAHCTLMLCLNEMK